MSRSWIRPTWHAGLLFVVCAALTATAVATGSPYPAAFAAGAFVSLVATFWRAHRRATATKIQVTRRLSRADVRRGAHFDVMLDASGSEIPHGVHTRFTDNIPAGVDARQGFRQVGVSTLAYPARAAFRGPVAFEAVTVDVEDSTGFWSHSRTVDAPADMQVTPGDEARMLGQRLVTPSRMDHALPGTVQALFRDERKDTIKPYGAGHRFRDIDWKAYARHRKLLVREWSGQADATITVLLDAGPGMRQDPERLEASADMALELIQSATRFNHAAGMTLFDQEQVLAHWRPTRDKGTLQRIRAGLVHAVHARLAGGRPDRKARQARKAMAHNSVSRIVRTAPSARRGGCILLFADVDGMAKRTVAHLADAVSKGQRLVVFPVGDRTEACEARLAKLRARGAEVMAVPGQGDGSAAPDAPATEAPVKRPARPVRNTPSPEVA